MKINTPKQVAKKIVYRAYELSKRYPYVHPEEGRGYGSINYIGEKKLMGEMALSCIPSRFRFISKIFQGRIKASAETTRHIFAGAEEDIAQGTMTLFKNDAGAAEAYLSSLSDILQKQQSQIIPYARLFGIRNPRVSKHSAVGEILPFQYRVGHFPSGVLGEFIYCINNAKKIISKGNRR